MYSNQTQVNYISVSELEAFNPDVDISKYTTATKSGIIQRASAIVDTFLDYSLTIEDVSNERSKAIVDTNGDLKIFTRKFPIKSLSSVKVELGSSSYTIDLQDGSTNKYNILNDGEFAVIPLRELEVTGSIFITSTMDMRYRDYFINVSYRAGYETIPADIKDAVSEICKQIIFSNNREGNLQSASQGGISKSWKNQDGMSSVIPDRARFILNNYARKIWI